MILSDFVADSSYILGHKADLGRESTERRQVDPVCGSSE
jgi:hypothetical protein